MNIKLIAALFLSVFYISAFANQEGAPTNDNHKPPKQAMDACSGKAKGDACSFTGPRGMMNIEGNCFAIASDNELVCVPKPPKVAVDACSGKKENDSCSFTGRNNDKIEGSCFKTLHGDVACRPSTLPSHPAENSNDMKSDSKMETK